MNQINIPPDIYYLDPAKQHLVSGKRSIKRIFFQNWPLWTALLLIGWFFSEEIVTIIREVRLSDQATTTTAGKITNCFEFKKRRRFYLFYRLKIQGQDYESEDRIGFCDNSMIGTDIEVTYATYDPDLSHIGGPGFKGPPMILNSIIAVFIIGIAVLIRARLSGGQSKRLPTQQLIFGRLKSSQKTSDERSIFGSYNLFISYHFLTPSGSSIEGHAFGTRNDTEELPQAGRSVAVLYTNDDEHMVI